MTSERGLPLALVPVLLGRWDEPHRRYHDRRHLDAVLAVVEQLVGEDSYAGDPDAVRLAAWFHDAVYDPTRDDNEQVSATLAAQLLPSHGVPAARVAQVARLVLLTATHDPAPGDVDGAALCDADLAVLARPAAAYDDYARDVRTEYAHVPDALFAVGRAQVLRSLLAQPVLFRSPGARAWEPAARENLVRELSRLDGGDGAVPPG